ncbi:hypothetical protein [Fredinandcohnia sp. 179-A 10B2 NHS]|uniref:hypothetical protein n=1 Tax=Fredinandcohnia sp. 179-A 10B2 NHS TaxID=3235176 RepID=UPI0039A1A2CC
MRKHNLIPVYMMVIFILLSGCTSSTSPEQIETSSTLHNYDIEMISKALEKHSDFPILNPDETL